MTRAAAGHADICPALRPAVSAGFGAWLRRQREGRGWSRQELAIRMAGAAGSAVTAPVPALESYISRWEAGNVAISARYRQLLDAVLGPGVEVPAPQPSSGPTPDPRKWVRAMHALASDIAAGTFRPGGRLPARAVLAQRYGLPADAVIRAQDELLSTGILSRGQVYGTLYVTQATDRQVPGAPLPAAPGPADPGLRTAAIPPGRAGRGGDGTAPPAARNPRAYARPDTRVPAVRAEAGTGPGEATRSAVPPLRVSRPPPTGRLSSCSSRNARPRPGYHHGPSTAWSGTGTSRPSESGAISASTPAPGMPTSRHPRLTCVPHPGQTETASGIALQRQHTPPAGPRPGPARSSHAGAPPAVFRAPR